jgi:hypothetical protein
MYVKLRLKNHTFFALRNPFPASFPFLASKRGKGVAAAQGTADMGLRLLTPKRHYGCASGRFEQRLDCFNFIFDAGITLFNGVFNLVEVQDLQLPEVRLD